MLNVSWNSSVLNSWRAKTWSLASFDHVMFTWELLAQSTGIWRSRPWVQEASAKTARALGGRPR